jgi:predicted GIY-YIG superfamily endonuclease
MKHFIYHIKNLNNGKIYVGMSSKPYRRWRVHLSQLKHNKHHNTELQEDFNNSKNIGFKSLACFENKREALDFERSYFEILGTRRYNRLYDRDNKNRIGYKHTFKTLEKISKSSKGANNAAFDDTKYALINKKTKETLAKTKYDWKSFLDCKGAIYELCSTLNPERKRNSIKGWKRNFCHLYEKPSDFASVLPGHQSARQDLILL